MFLNRTCQLHDRPSISRPELVYLKIGNLPKKVTKTIKEMPSTASAIVAMVPILYVYVARILRSLSSKLLV